MTNRDSEMSISTHEHRRRSNFLHYLFVLVVGLELTSISDASADLVPSAAICASPIKGLKSSELLDSFYEIHHGHPHQAIDIKEPYGTPVHAVVDGTVQKLFVSRMGGNTLYEFGPKAQYCYYYAHLDRYADGIHEGKLLKHGDIVGYVGTSGNAAAGAPHLHLAVERLHGEKHWWQGTPIDPYPILINFLETGSGNSACRLSTGGA